MTTFLLDKFTLDGVLDGSFPEIGRASTAWEGDGIKSGGYLEALNDTTYNRFYGEIRLPSSGYYGYTHLTVRARWLFSTGSPVKAYFEFTEGWYEGVFQYNTTSGSPTCTGILGPIDVAAVNHDGENDVVVSLNLQDKTALTYINGALVQSGLISISDPSASQLYFAIGATTERFDGTPLHSKLAEIEITDVPYVPQVDPFWTELARAEEIP